MKDEIIINKLLKKQPIRLSETFLDATLSAINDENAADAAREKFIDAELARMRHFKLSRLADNVIASIRRTSAIWRKIRVGSFAATTAACAAIAIILSTQAADSPSDSISINDYENMSLIADEISAISALLVQEEVRDIFSF